MFVLHGLKLVVDTYQLFLLFKITSYIRSMVIISVFQSMNNIFLHLICLSLSLFLFVFFCYKHLICGGRNSWSQTTQGNGILLNESCDIAPLYAYSPKDQRISQTEYIVRTLFSICTSLQKLGSDRFL